MVFDSPSETFFIRICESWKKIPSQTVPDQIWSSAMVPTFPL